MDRLRFPTFLGPIVGFVFLRSSIPRGNKGGIIPDVFMQQFSAFDLSIGVLYTQGRERIEMTTRIAVGYPSMMILM
jgi:hypothetical protein